MVLPDPLVRKPGYLSDGDVSRGRTAGLASRSRTKASTALPMRGMAVLQQNPSDKSLSAITVSGLF